MIQGGKSMQNFNFHTHTYRCGHADLDFLEEEYVEEFIKMGFKKIAFTDHCPEKNEIDKRPDIRMKYSQKEEYLNTIKALKEKYADKIEIESGFEVEYLPEEEETLKELKRESDKIILGQHFVYDNNKELIPFSSRREFSDEEIMKYSQYIEKALELHIPDIIAHPDFFMKSRKNFGEADKKVTESIGMAAEKYGIPLEINLNDIYRTIYHDNDETNQLSIEDVKYPCREFWEIISKYNVKVLYGIDVHYRGQILLWNELLKLGNEILRRRAN